MKAWEHMRDLVRQARMKGLVPLSMTRGEIVDWVHGQTALSNPEITRELVAQVVDEALERRGA